MIDAVVQDGMKMRAQEPKVLVIESLDGEGIQEPYYLLGVKRRLGEAEEERHSDTQLYPGVCLYHANFSSLRPPSLIALEQQHLDFAERRMLSLRGENNQPFPDSNQTAQEVQEERVP